MSDSFQALKEKMEGKRILRVDPPDASEAICKFILEDGTAFRLHATDLGYWIEDTVNEKGMYSSLSGLFQDVGHRLFDLFYKEPCTKGPTVRVKEGVLRILTSDGAAYEANIQDLNEWEQKVCKHPKGKKLIKQAAALGDMWSIVFLGEECPPELRIRQE